ncbi:hypothetical protein D3C85_1045790 [compost metagenome]
MVYALRGQITAPTLDTLRKQSLLGLGLFNIIPPSLLLSLTTLGDVNDGNA